MSVSGINSGIMGSLMIQMRQMVDLDMKDALTKANTDNGNPLGTTIDFSKPSELLSKLENLKNEDPQKFKDVLQEISDLLKNAADSTDDTSLSTFLTTLSEKFADVAESGDLTQLNPPEPKLQNGGQSSKVAQYDSNSGGQQSLLEILMQLIQQMAASSSTDTDTESSDKTSSVKNLLSKALQELTSQETAATDKSGATNSVENLLAKAIIELNGNEG
jgi:hypothetical protein